MQTLLEHLQIKVAAPAYVKDPNSSELGKRIQLEGLALLSELGLEGFTFKKLALRLQTTESSIYRYFVNKHQLLVYYSSLYWGWMDYILTFRTANIEDPSQKLKIALQAVSAPDARGELGGLLPMERLLQVVEEESLKVFFTKEVDAEDREGLFIGFRNLSARLAGLIRELQPDYPCAMGLSSMILNAINQQRFNLRHMPDMAVPGNEEDVAGFFYQLVHGVIDQYKEHYGK